MACFTLPRYGSRTANKHKHSFEELYRLCCSPDRLLYAVSIPHTVHQWKSTDKKWYFAPKVFACSFDVCEVCLANISIAETLEIMQCHRVFGIRLMLSLLPLCLRKQFHKLVGFGFSAADAMSMQYLSMFRWGKHLASLRDIFFALFLYFATLY